MTYRGVLKGKTIVLDEEPDLPKKTPVLVELRPVDEATEENLRRKHLALMRNAPKVGRLLYAKRDELYER